MDQFSRFAILFLLALFPCKAFCDAAPPQYYCRTELLPLEDTSVRMKDAFVDITYDTPMCDLNARFVMVNDSDKTVEMDVGFPIDAKSMFTNTGKTLFEPDIYIDDVLAKDMRFLSDKQHEEYICCFVSHRKFPPGESTIVVKGHILFSPCSSNHRMQSIFYILKSGGMWKGPIGREVVTIHFPDDFDPGNYCVPQTPGSTIDGHSITWDFHNFEPKGDDYDIHADFVIPRIVREIERLRRVHVDKPEDCDAALRAANAMLTASLQYYLQSYAPPFTLTRDQLERIECKLPNLSMKEHFRSMYSPIEGEKEMWVCDRSREMAPDEIQEIDRILVELGERRHYGLLQVTEEGLAILAEQTRKHPDDPDTWMLYLNYFSWLSTNSLSFYSYGLCPTIPESAEFWEVAANACKHCSNDPRIDAWKTFMDSKRQSNDYQALRLTLRSLERSHPSRFVPYY